MSDMVTLANYSIVGGFIFAVVLTLIYVFVIIIGVGGAQIVKFPLKLDSVPVKITSEDVARLFSEDPEALDYFDSSVRNYATNRQVLLERPLTSDAGRQRIDRSFKPYHVMADTSRIFYRNPKIFDTQMRALPGQMNAMESLVAHTNRNSLIKQQMTGSIFERKDLEDFFKHEEEKINLGYGTNLEPETRTDRLAEDSGVKKEILLEKTQKILGLQTTSTPSVIQPSYPSLQPSYPSLQPSYPSMQPSYPSITPSPSAVQQPSPPSPSPPYPSTIQQSSPSPYNQYPSAPQPSSFQNGQAQNPPSFPPSNFAPVKVAPSLYSSGIIPNFASNEFNFPRKTESPNQGASTPQDRTQTKKQELTDQVVATLIQPSSRNSRTSSRTPKQPFSPLGSGVNNGLAKDPYSSPQESSSYMRMGERDSNPSQRSKPKLRLPSFVRNSSSNSAQLGPKSAEIYPSEANFPQIYPVQPKSISAPSFDQDASVPSKYPPSSSGRELNVQNFDVPSPVGDSTSSYTREPWPSIGGEGVFAQNDSIHGIPPTRPVSYLGLVNDSSGVQAPPQSTYPNYQINPTGPQTTPAYPSYPSYLDNVFRNT